MLYVDRDCRGLCSDLGGANTTTSTRIRILLNKYLHQLRERSPDGKILPYNYAMSQIGHEMGHRWAAFVSAKVNGQAIQLGPVHWARGVAGPGGVSLPASDGGVRHGRERLAG